MINNSHKIWITEDYIDDSFDHEFYSSEYPDTLSYCNYLEHTSLRERLYNHYHRFGQKENRFKNSTEKEKTEIDNTSLLGLISLDNFQFKQNKLESICLLTTTKEILNGSYNHFISRIEENTTIAKNIDFIISINKSIDIEKLHIDILKPKFKNIGIINLELSSIEDVYIKNIDINIKDLPVYGTKSGPNIMFFRSIERCQKYNTTLFLETDCFLKPGWLDKIQDFVLHSNGFWISGAIYDGTIPCKASSCMMTHINGGTALYATGNKDFQSFMHYAENFILQKIQDGLIDLAYDYGIKIFIDHNINNHMAKIEDILLWKLINRQYLPNKLIGNFSTNSDQDLSIDDIDRMYNYYIIHKK